MHKQPENTPRKKQGYMQELNEWAATQVIGPVQEAFAEYDKTVDSVPEDQREKQLDQKLAEVEWAIRAKVLESYRNGLEAARGRNSSMARAKS